MDAAPRWQQSRPWLRAWPAATLVLALHVALLRGWPATVSGMRPAEALVSSIQVRMLSEPSALPSPSLAAPVPPRDSRTEATEMRLAADSRVAGEAAGGSPRLDQPPAPRPSGSAPNATQAAAPAATPPGLRPAPDYQMASRLDPGPKLLDDVEPVYPAEAGLKEGSVVLRILIGASGTVDDVTVVRSSPAGLFDRSAAAAFAAAHFSPGMMLGVPVKSQLTIEVQFTPINRGANVSAPTY